MKIVDAKRNEENQIVFVLEDGSEVTPSEQYIQDNKPQIDDEFVEEVAQEAAPEVSPEEPK